MGVGEQEPAADKRRRPAAGAPETNDNDTKPSTGRRIPRRPLGLGLGAHARLLRVPAGQVSAAAAAAAAAVPVQQRPAAATAAAIELAGVAPALPLRPARLPAAYAAGRYANLVDPRRQLHHLRHQQAPDKPNRYSWARDEGGSQARGGSATLPADAAAIGKPISGHFSSHLSSAASRVFVVNPMHIVNLSEHTKSRLVKIIEALKRFSEKWFSHVLLLLFLAVYACFGAYIFLTFEAPTERAEKQQIIDFRQSILNATTGHQQNLTQLPQLHMNASSLEAYNRWLSEQLVEYENLLGRACASGITSSSLENQWNFWGALFYSMTVFTTIGYGHLAPVTFAGRVATVAYAIFGIPILLMVLADLGKLLTRIIKFTFRKLHHLYSYLIHRKSSIRTRRLISRSTRHYKRAGRAAVSRWLSSLGAYLRVPAARSACRRWRLRFWRASEKAAREPEKGADEPPEEAPAATEVIVTPARQTKPVSPQPGMHLSATGLIAGSVTNEHRNRGRPLAHHQARHQHRNPGQAHNAHTCRPGGRQHRSQSPSQTGSSRRKNSLGARNPKGSVSRSSSSSMVAAAAASPRGSQVVSQEQVSPTGELAKTPVESAREEQEAEEEEQRQLYDDYLEEPLELEEEEEEEEEEDFDIPVSFALFLLVAYMILGASLFGIWEGWDFFSSLYFVFISMSTIGFGDLVPKQQPKRMIGTFIYLLFGLALTSMCINVVQEKIHATFLRAKMQLGEKMGLDLDQIMADDYYAGSLGPDDYDCQSAAGSQCALHPGTPAGGCCECCPTDQPAANHSHNHNHNHSHHHHQDSQHSTCEPAASAGPPAAAAAAAASKGTRLSRGSSSLRSRPQLRPPSHNHNHNHSSHANNQTSIPLVRKASARRLPAATKSPPGSCAESSMSTPSTPARLLEEQRQPSLVPKAVQQAQQVAQVSADRCNPLVSNRTRLEGTQSQPSAAAAAADIRLPAAGAAKTVSKSMSSEFGAGSAASRCAGPLSASSSRRSSVSQELNQLDDIIQTLGKSASVQRFGPLLGIPVPKSQRPSRTSSPAVEPPAHLKTPAPATQRRATSMTHARVARKPVALAKPAPAVESANNSSLAAEAAIEQLEAVKLSFT